MEVKPLHDRVLVKQFEVKEVKNGTIIIPDSAKTKPCEGEVIAVGAGKTGDDGKRIALDVKTGDKVIYAKYAGNEVKIEGEEFLLMREDDILGIIG